jgi:hypothetical protein
MTDDDIRQSRTDAISRKNLPNLLDVPLLESLYVNVEHQCDQWPSLESNESCNKNALLVFIKRYLFDLDTLIVKSNYATLDAISVWGALRGLETFSQLIHTDEDLLVRFLFYCKKISI